MPGILVAALKFEPGQEKSEDRARVTASRLREPSGVKELFKSQDRWEDCRGKR